VLTTHTVRSLSENHSVINDSDGLGEIGYGGALMPTGKKLADHHWQSDDGQWTYVFEPNGTASTTATPYKTGGPKTITIHNCTMDGFGITLSDARAASPTTSTSVTCDDEFIKAVNGEQRVTPSIGYASASAATNTPDAINGTAGAVRLTGGSGNDGPSGDDGVDVIEGGDGSDSSLGSRSPCTFRQMRAQDAAQRGQHPRARAHWMRRSQPRRVSINEARFAAGAR
jgi:hypothetical protein